MISAKHKILFAALLLLVVIDYAVFSQMAVQHTRWCWDSEWSYDADKTSTVAIVRSDNQNLAAPVSITDTLGYEQVAAMVEYAVSLAGGLESYLQPEDRKIVLKPNLVEATVRGNGCVTDWRVVRALVLMLYRINPEFQIRVAEGAGGWARPGTPNAPNWALTNGDGYETSGFKDMIENLRADTTTYPGLDVDWVDLNYDEVEATTAASPALSDAQWFFYLPKTLLDADFLINVPVMKVHTTGITVGLKNYVGALPGMTYGWSKDQGYNNNGIGLDHTAKVLQKNFVDIARTVGCDFMVVDAIVGKEKTKFASGTAMRRNMIVAGEDIVSVDAVCAHLMDINPDDVEHITMAALVGFGQNDMEKITILGNTIEESATPFVKAEKQMDASHRNSSYRHYGQSNRSWLLNGPFFGSSIDQDLLAVGEQNAQPHAGVAGWSEAVYFYDDLIDPAGFYQDSADCIYYASSYLEAPRNGQAKLWAGSDGDMQVWLNGEQVYDYSGGVRNHKLPNDVVDVAVLEGFNTLLVKVKQTSGVCRFSLNICEPETGNQITDYNYAGDRLAGVRFTTRARVHGDYDGDGIVSIFDLLDLLKMLRVSNPDPVYDFNADGRVDIFDLLGLLKALKGV